MVHVQIFQKVQSHLSMVFGLILNFSLYYWSCDGRSLVLLTCDCMSVKTLVLTMSSDHNRSSSNQNAGTFLLNSQSAKSVICWSWGALSSVNISLKESLRGWPDWLSVYLYPETRRKHQQSLRQYHVHWSASMVILNVFLSYNPFLTLVSQTSCSWLDPVFKTFLVKSQDVKTADNNLTRAQALILVTLDSLLPPVQYRRGRLHNQGCEGHDTEADVCKHLQGDMLNPKCKIWPISQTYSNLPHLYYSGRTSRQS